MAPCGERPPTLAGLLPSLRSGVLLADIAAAATGEKFVVRPTSKTPHRIWAHIQTGFGPTFKQGLGPHSNRVWAHTYTADYNWIS